jgi:hypothetical protein
MTSTPSCDDATFVGLATVDLVAGPAALDLDVGWEAR